ncbi:MAG: hypothetical protein JXX29_13855 [Deltaproteobacteria bacterium]|nr:hypothetical protein [Deltaproteobacteria bacterium]MBN2672761.1 hypothetical protein [Deltaproteobacteria bacterium]
MKPLFSFVTHLLVVLSASIGSAQNGLVKDASIFPPAKVLSLVHFDSDLGGYNSTSVERSTGNEATGVFAMQLGLGLLWQLPIGSWFELDLGYRLHLNSFASEDEYSYDSANALGHTADARVIFKIWSNRYSSTGKFKVGPSTSEYSWIHGGNVISYMQYEGPTVSSWSLRIIATHESIFFQPAHSDMQDMYDSVGSYQPLVGAGVRIQWEKSVSLSEAVGRRLAGYQTAHLTILAKYNLSAGSFGFDIIALTPYIRKMIRLGGMAFFAKGGYFPSCIPVEWSSHARRLSGGYFLAGMRFSLSILK